jgi:2-methylisocitrate lyase-like PEP mutase family enzyme
MPGSFRQIIDKAVAEKRFLVVPGAHDALSARLIQKIGFETYFIGGFPAVGSRYGVPDVGLKGFGEISAAVRDIMGRATCRCSSTATTATATSRTWCTPCRATSAWA